MKTLDQLFSEENALTEQISILSRKRDAIRKEISNCTKRGNLCDLIVGKSYRFKTYNGYIIAEEVK